MRDRIVVGEGKHRHARADGDRRDPARVGPEHRPEQHLGAVGQQRSRGGFRPAGAGGIFDQQGEGIVPDLEQPHLRRVVELAPEGGLRPG